MTELKVDTYKPVVRDLIIYPNDILKENCLEVMPDRFGTPELNHLIQDMFVTMKTNNGIGMAAPQIGVLDRIIVINVTEPLVMINPVIIGGSGVVKSEEGCLSLPDVFNKHIKRKEEVHIVYQDVDGNNHEGKADQLLATVIQHEMDHLDGIIMLDRMGAVSKMRAIKKLKNASK